MDQVGVTAVQRAVVHAEASGHPGIIGLHEHISPGQQGRQGLAAGDRLKVEGGTALAPIPDQVPGKDVPVRVSPGRLHLDDIGPPVRREPYR